MSDSDSSALSSAASTEDEAVAASISKSIGLEKYFKRAKPESPPPPKRPQSPPHEYVLADNPDIAFIVTFRERFSDVFPRSLPHFGPQEIEIGVTDLVPGEHIERLLCALIGLVLNRKKDVERGHYQRALEEAVQTHTQQWPRSWEGKNPLSGGNTFAAMSPEERLGFLKALILWALTSSEAVQNLLKHNYKLTRHDRDQNQPLAVLPWGYDTWKRRFWLIEGRDDTHFRLYRETPAGQKTNTWWSVAGTIDEIKSVAEKLGTERSRAAKDLSKKIYDTVPRFENSEEKRKRRDYRLARKAAFSRPESGISLYEGRTRGKRIKYTFSDEEGDFSSDAVPSRRSTRFQSGVSTPAEANGPVVTASGRQVRSRLGGFYGESMLSGRRPEAEDANGDGTHEPSNGASHRTRTSAGSNGWTQPADHIEGYNSIDEMDDEADAVSSGDDYNAAEAEANFADDDGDDDDDMSDGKSMDEEDMELRRSLVVNLSYGKGKETGKVETPSYPESDIKDAPIKEEKPPPPPVPEAVQSPPRALPLNGVNGTSAPALYPEVAPERMEIDSKPTVQASAEDHNPQSLPLHTPPMQPAPEPQSVDVSQNGGA